MMIAFDIVKKRKQNGYTLIELLLVVTVIALIAALAVKSYRDKAQSDRINIAALSMQHVLESAMAYNVANNGLWPKNNIICSSAPTDVTFVQKYLPNENNQSNFGTAFCWSGDDPTAGVQKAPRFWVALAITSDTPQDAESTAKRIAARLPNAIVTDNITTESTTAPSNLCNGKIPCYVKAEVAIPSTTSNNQSGLNVSAVGYCDPNAGADDKGTHQGPQPGSGAGASCSRTTIANQFANSGIIIDAKFQNLDSLSQYKINFQCKSGETPKVYLTPNFLRETRFSATYQVDPAYEISTAPEDPAAPDYVDYNNYCTGVTPANGMVTCTVTLLATYDAQGGGRAIPVGCTNDYLTNSGGQFCHCSIGPNGKTELCGDKTGAIGASYVAVCSSAKASAISGNSNAKQGYW